MYLKIQVKRKELYHLYTSMAPFYIYYIIFLLHSQLNISEKLAIKI